MTGSWSAPIAIELKSPTDPPLSTVVETVELTKIAVNKGAEGELQLAAPVATKFSLKLQIVSSLCGRAKSGSSVTALVIAGNEKLLISTISERTRKLQVF